MEKQTYYVSVPYLTCTAYPGASSYDFKVELEPHEENPHRLKFHFIPYYMDELN